MGNIVVSVVSGTVTGISEYKESRNLKSAILNGVFDGVASAAPGLVMGICKFKKRQLCEGHKRNKGFKFHPNQINSLICTGTKIFSKKC